MKNIKIALIALITSVTIFSCTDAIDIVQPGNLSEDAAFQTPEDLQKGLLAAYGSLSPETEIGFNSIFTDEVSLGLGNGGQGLLDGEYGFFLNSGSSAPGSLWYDYYGTINYTNRIIRAAEHITPDPENIDEQSAYYNTLAQAHVLRAWAHFTLLSYYSADMSDDSSLGIILVDFVPTIEDKLPRNTTGEVLALINADLAYYDTAITGDMTRYNDDNSDRKYISPDFVKAFRVRMAAYRKDYATAGTLADELIASYPLTARAQFTNIWKDLPVTGNDEVIFRLDRVNGNAKVGNIWASVDATASGSPFYEVSTDLYALLTTPGDVRKTAYTSTAITTEDGEFVTPIGKYPGSGGLALLNDIKVFRTSEMILIKAESLAAAGDFAGVAAQLQKINNARFTASTVPTVAVPANETAAWAAILLARRVELAYEGHRYLDFKRLGVKAGVDINRDPADCARNGACFFSNTDYRLTFPVPSAEVGANRNIQQTSGY
ncbi:MAG: RagB/SusD family nutrient uptake outer membrane protein [Flavobacterium sp.]|nr:RagB/SusD family nutrient uptake outer membrane protein [Flavobacterium sp.]